MKVGRGITGYILLILSTAFLDTDFLSLAAMPVFIVSTGLITAFYLSLPAKEPHPRMPAILLIFPGTLLLAVISGYAGIKYIAYLRTDSGQILTEPFPSLRLDFIPVMVIYLFASLLILTGIRQRSRLPAKRLFLVWIPSLLVIPLVILLIKIFQIDKLGI